MAAATPRRDTRTANNNTQLIKVEGAAANDCDCDDDDGIFQYSSLRLSLSDIQDVPKTPTIVYKAKR